MQGKARTIIIIVLLLLAVAGCIFLLGRGLGRAEAAERPPSLKQELITLLSESSLARRVQDWFSVGMEYEKASSGESVSVRDLTSLYRNDREERVLYLTIQKGTEKENTNHSWEDLNAFPSTGMPSRGSAPMNARPWSSSAMRWARSWASSASGTRWPMPPSASQEAAPPPDPRKAIAS